MIRTVKGDIDRFGGRVLTHEHLQIDLSQIKGPHVVIGLDDKQNVIDDVFYLKEQQFGAIVDVTAPEIGRDPNTLAQISQITGISIVCSTGFYWDPFSMDVVNNPVEKLIEFLVTELTEGVHDTNVRCGVIKIGTKPGDTGKVEEKVFQAAASAQKMTGAPIITHCSHPKHALWQIETLEHYGADLSQVLIGHMDSSDENLLMHVLNRGVFIGIDQISFSWVRSDEERAKLVKLACDNGFENKVIISSDVARKTRLRTYGGKSYSTVIEDFVPLLHKIQVSPDHIETILQRNPNELLSWK